MIHQARRKAGNKEKEENKMEIVIKETGAVETLLLIDSKTGCDWFNDLVGNHDGFGDDPECEFVKETDEDGLDTGRYITSKANFEWWEDIVCQIDNVNNRIDNLKNEFGVARVDEVVYQCNYGNTDLEYYAVELNRWLDDEFGESAGR
jgi:hypothetical protein